MAAAPAVLLCLVKSGFDEALFVCWGSLLAADSPCSAGLSEWGSLWLAPPALSLQLRGLKLCDE